MAARRLIIVLLVLFAVSIVAASIAPERRGGGVIGGDSSTSTTTTTTTAEADPLPQGESLTVRIDASSKDPETVEGFVGDQLELNVGSDARARVIEIEKFGVTEDAGPDAPANFNLLLREPARVPITDAESGEILGRLLVRKPLGAKGGGGGGGGGPVG